MHDTRLMGHLRHWFGDPHAAYPPRSIRGLGDVQVLGFHDQPCPGAITWCTAGLSRLPGQHLHQELLMALWQADATGEMEAVLEWVASQLADGRAPLRDGDVLPPVGPITARTRMEAFLAWAPVDWPDEAGAFEDEDGAWVRITWLIPLHASEAREAVADPVAFVRLLAEVDPDLPSLAPPGLTVWLS